MIDDEMMEGDTSASRQRELIVAYLSYALDDVGALSPVGLRLLQMTIASLTEEIKVSVVEQPSQFLS